MDPITYQAAKDEGRASIRIMEDGKTVLVSMPEGDQFDPKTGQPKPPVDRGYQAFDIAAMMESDDKAVQAAQEQLQAALARQAAWPTVIAEIEVKLAAPEAVKARADAEIAAQKASAAR